MKRLTSLLLLFILLLSACAVPSSEDPGVNEPWLEVESLSCLSVHFIDVGQADAILLLTTEGTVLIDGGNVGTDLELLRYLKRYNVDKIDLMINTHPHGDHLGGLPLTLAYIPTETVWTSTMDYDSSLFDRFLQNADKQDADVVVPSPGTVYTLGRLTLTVLGPLGSNYSDLNDTSLVVIAEYGDFRFLFTGDMETFAENQLLARDVDLKADVLKVGHHGSYSSTSSQFLREVDPDYGVISCGRDNEYGHPHDAPMNRLEAADVELYRTDLMGNVIVVTDGSGMAFFWEIADAVPSDYDQAA